MPNSQTIANIAATLMCVLVGAVAVQKLQPTPTIPTVQPRPSLLAVGQPIEALDDFELGKSGTLVIAFSSQCPYCIASVPFYKKLSAIPRMDGLDFRMIVLAMDGLDPVTDYLASAGLAPHTVASFPKARPLAIQGTPTVLLLEGDGRLKDSWVGQLTPEAEASILARVLGDTAETAGNK